MTIAADTHLMKLCRAVVDPSTETNLETANAFDRVCHDLKLNPDLIKNELNPAAKALGLIPPYQGSADFYHVIGVQSQAGMGEIKRAFRQKAITVHPDVPANPNCTSQAFIELNNAYRTLSDPESRRKYDTDRYTINNWHESLSSSNSVDSNPTMILLFLCGLLFIFILFFSVLNFLI
jgi:hypothetical protein